MDVAPSPALLALHDGAAGNRRQALALAEILGLPVDELVLQPRLPWRWAAPRILPASERAFGPAFAARLADPPLLAVGCGRQAALATRLLRARGTRVVQVLHPRLPAAHWDALVLPEHDGVPEGGNCHTLRGSLNPIDDAWLAAARAERPDLGLRAAPRTVLLVGGPTDASDWDGKTLESALELLLRWQARDGGELAVLCSRRTPRGLRRQLAQGLAGRAEVWTGDSDGPNPYASRLAWADRVVVTPDSANLISEAAATRAPMWIAFPRYTRGRLRTLVEAAIDGGRARPLGPDAPAWPVQPWRERERVAERLQPLVREALGRRDQGPSTAPPDDSAGSSAAMTSAAG